MKKLKSIFILLLVGLVSCDDFFISDVEPPKSGVETQLIVHSYLSPNENVILVSVKQSKPLFSEKYEKFEEKQVEDAKVVLTNQRTKEKITIPFDSARRKYATYTSEFPINEGNTYQLNVSTPNGKSAEAFCTIPKAVNVKIRNIKLKTVENHYKEKYTQISFEFDDLSEYKNYYGAFAVVKYLGYAEDYKGRVEVELERKNEFVLTTLDNDEKTFYAKSKNKNFIPLDKIKSVEIKVYSMDKNYYNYKKTVEMQMKNDDENPFKEPTIIVSNIKNGLGVFGAYTVKKVKKPF